MNSPPFPDPRQNLKESVERLVRTRIGGLVRGLRVEVLKRDVVLSGRASTYYAKQLATHAALSHDAFTQPGMFSLPDDDGDESCLPLNVSNEIEVG